MTEALSKALIAYFKAGIPALNSVIEGFPAPSQKLQYPAMSIFIRDPKLLTGSPYVVKKVDRTTGSDPQKTITKIFGIYEVSLQLDIWTSTRPHRHQLAESVLQILNPDPEMVGLNLKLDDYYGEWAHIYAKSYRFIEDEAASQRNEWRILVDVQADLHALFEKVDYVIKTIENNLELPANIPSPFEPEPETEKTI
jgi:hypothetical protein